MAEPLLTLQTDGRQGENKRRRGEANGILGRMQVTPAFQEGRSAFLM